jgi:TATA-box binding protein (TBP) (component of TFIID and TFIIIB)
MRKRSREGTNSFSLKQAAWKISEASKHLHPYPDVVLSREIHHLPKVVNMVCTTKLLNGMDDDEVRKSNGYGINLYRIALNYPNVKYEQKRFAAITLRLWGSTGLLFESGKMVLVSALSEKHALFCAQQYRQWLETVDLLMWDEKEKRSYIGNLKGMLNCRDTKVYNVVASGSLFQDGVDLSSLMEAHEDKCSWVPDSFPNGTFGPELLSDGETFNANVSDRNAKIVIMGVTKVEQVYEAYKFMKDLVSDHEDPEAPDDPRKCYLYRMNKLLKNDPRMRVKKLNRKKGAKKKRKAGDDEEEEVDDAEEVFLDKINNWASLSKRKRFKYKEDDKKDEEDEGGLMSFVMDAVDFATSGTSAPKSQAMDGEEGYTPLMKAAVRKQLKNVQQLVSQGYSITDTTPEGKTAYDLVKDSDDPQHKLIALILVPN